MKFKIIDRSNEQVVETYSVDLSMLDFQEWHKHSEVTIDLTCLAETVANLNSLDPETQEPVSSPIGVDIYLPIALENKSQAETEVTLKSSTILSAVVTEILRNHHLAPEYQVRISDE